MNGLNRIELIRQSVDAILAGREDSKWSRNGFVHLYGVSLLAGLIAGKREQNIELAIVAGMLHDISSYKLGSYENHHQLSSDLAREMLTETGRFTGDEIELICKAVRNHGKKQSVDGMFDEVLKDADVPQHHYYNPFTPGIAGEKARLSKIFSELQRSG